MDPFPAPAPHAWTYIEHPDHLAQVAAQLRAVDVLAVDAEFVQVRARGPEDPPHRLALLQLAGMPGVTGAYVIDALRLPDFAPLEPLFDDGRILKLFHGIGADSRVLATRGLTPHHLLDLEAVSRSIFGQRESGLRTMLQRAGRVRIDKSLQRSDWTRRPLTPAMLAYAARDAEMTLLLYQWLTLRYPWAIALHEVPTDEPPLAVARWVAPFLDGARPERPEWAVASAGLEGKTREQEDALRQTLAAVRRPNQRARAIRLIADLELAGLAADVRPFLGSAASEERASAARALGRLRATDAESSLRALLDDPVQDVREAAEAALNLLTLPAASQGRSAVTRSREGGTARWTLNDAADAPADTPAWQAALLARFGANTSETRDDATEPASGTDAPPPTDTPATDD